MTIAEPNDRFQPIHHTMNQLTPRNCVAAMLISLGPLLACAQTTAGTGVHETTSTEFVGYFKLIPIPNDKQPSRDLAKPPFQGLCQYFVHQSNQDWVHVDIKNLGGDADTQARCSYTRSALATQMTTMGRSAITWQKIDHGIATINREKNVVNLWKVDTIERPFDASGQLGVRLEPDDLLLQLVNSKGTEVLWRLVLRRLPD